MFLNGKVATHVKGGTIKGKNRRLSIDRYKTSEEVVHIIRTKTLQDRGKRIFLTNTLSFGEEAYTMLIAAINGINKLEGENDGEAS